MQPFHRPSEPPFFRPTVSVVINSYVNGMSVCFQAHCHPGPDDSEQSDHVGISVKCPMRPHANYKSIGTDDLLQDRGKSIPIQCDEYPLIAMRYVEENPLRANFVELMCDERVLPLLLPQTCCCSHSRAIRWCYKCSSPARFRNVIKNFVKHGDSWALVIDWPMFELLKIDPEMPVEVTTDGRTVTITPAPDPHKKKVREARARINERHSAAFKKLAE